MSRHHTLRLAVLTAVAAGAMLVPVSAAVADDPTPTQTASPSDDGPTLKEKTAADKKAKELEARKAAAGKDLPRGGVAAGEAPADDNGVTTLAGSAAGALLLAGAGTYVLRRRSAARHNG
ncbi:hypothetical protein QF026_007754 [Streptomyces aurantiacus]|uniref:hypothetical protein n=1 Tax=Streptomyces aurantiacus TaxID=47760 RepID=UPI002794ED78|nr:hypothetical protein [Streptomyces aurantiacus]MDQ0779288.1 hypothetical protein [Streptomyces aurantiacus]